MKKLYFIWMVLWAMGCATSNKIVERPIVFDAQREALSLVYLSDRYGLQKESPTIVPKMVVLHWTVIPTFEESFEFFKNATLSKTRGDISGAGALNVSSHFMVDRDGTIYQLLPETTMARHVIGLNHCAIGVENVGGTQDLPLTKAQLKSNIWLVNYLAEKYDIEYVIGHHEYTNFEGHPLWLEKDEGYRTQKTDPGPEFMRKIRQATKNLNFKPIPQKKIFHAN